MLLIFILADLSNQTNKLLLLQFIKQYLIKEISTKYTSYMLA